MKPTTLSAALLALACLGWTGPGEAQSLRIGVRAAIDTADPASSFSPNRNVTLHVYEPLLLQDEALRPMPGLATAWRMRDPLTWEFRLRDGVTFHDGSPLSAADIARTFERNMATETPQTYKSNLREVTAVEAEGPGIVLIRTRVPSPGLPYDLATFGIVSARATEGASPEDFRGRAAIGTGPYRWREWTPGQGVTLSRNPAYWGERPAFETVEFRFVPNDSARVAALLSGDLDVADAVPPGLTARVQASPNARLLSTTAIMMLYLQLDQSRERSPYVTGADGQPLAHNPLRDVRVRRAIGHAVNRAAIAERAMEGAAEPAGQFMAPGLDGHDPSLQPMPYDAARARALLAEAGYPQGFGLTLNCTNDRYPGDSRVCQALGQMLGAVGIRTRVEAIPISVLFRRRTGGPEGGPDMSAYMIGYGAPNGLATAALSSLVRSMDRDRGRGGNNYAGYSDARLDAMIDGAETELDPARRAGMVRDATRMAMEEAAIVPVYFTKAIWGLRRGLTLTPRADSFTFATTVRPGD